MKHEVLNMFDDNTSVKQVVSEDPSFAEVVAKQIP